MADIQLGNLSRLHVRQVHELGEWIGFETRNKYQIQSDGGIQIGYAAEQQKGILGFLLRQFLGHWRSFDVHFYDTQRTHVMTGHHPFRFFFQRIELTDNNGQALGAIQKRFSILTKRFDIESKSGGVLFEVASPIWKIWTFTFTRNTKVVAEVKKKWSGLLSEAFTDKDNFEVNFIDPSLQETERKLLLASAVFIDLLYFEHKK